MSRTPCCCSGGRVEGASTGPRARARARGRRLLRRGANGRRQALLGCVDARVCVCLSTDLALRRAVGVDRPSEDAARRRREAPPLRPHAATPRLDSRRRGGRRGGACPLSLVQLPQFSRGGSLQPLPCEGSILPASEPAHATQRRRSAPSSFSATLRSAVSLPGSPQDKDNTQWSLTGSSEQHANNAAELTRLDDADFREAHCLETGTEARVATGRLCGDARYFVVRCARPGRLRATQQMPFAAFQELRRQLGEQAALVKSPFPCAPPSPARRFAAKFFRASVDAAAADRARARALEAGSARSCSWRRGARCARARAGPCATRCSTTSVRRRRAVAGEGRVGPPEPRARGAVDAPGGAVAAEESAARARRAATAAGRRRTNELASTTVVVTRGRAPSRARCPSCSRAWRRGDGFGGVCAVAPCRPLGRPRGQNDCRDDAGRRFGRRP